MGITDKIAGAVERARAAGRTAGLSPAERETAERLPYLSRAEARRATEQAAENRQAFDAVQARWQYLEQDYQDRVREARAADAEAGVGTWEHGGDAAVWSPESYDAAEQEMVDYYDTVADRRGDCAEL